MPSRTLRFVAIVWRVLRRFLMFAVFLVVKLSVLVFHALRSAVDMQAPFFAMSPQACDHQTKHASEVIIDDFVQT